MRTTLTLEDEAFSTARAYASARAIKLGQAVSELIRRGSAPQLALKQHGDVWVFDLPADTPTLTSEQVRDLLDQ